MEENINRGVIIVEPNANDYICGASPLPIVIINPLGDNRPYKPDAENQSGKGADKMDCVTVSSSGSIETIFRILHKNGLMPQGCIDYLKKWNFYNANGDVQISTRWASIQNGTTNKGNSANAVAQWWRDNGFIPEWMLPNDQTLEWNPYYDTACLTDQMKQCAKEGLDFFDINYEWITNEDYKTPLQRGAIQILTAVCPGWSTIIPIPACSLSVCHATELLNVEPDVKKDIWDSYTPNAKTFASDYPVPYKMLYLLTTKTMDTNQFLKDNDLKWVRNTDNGSFGRMLQGELKIFVTTDRATLALLDDKVRTNGVQITNDVWSKLPQTNF